MNVYKEILYNTIRQIKLDSGICDNSDNAVRELQEKYEMPFLGEDNNTILSESLRLYINCNFNYSIDTELFNDILDSVSNGLRLDLKPIKKANSPVTYKIILW